MDNETGLAADLWSQFIAGTQLSQPEERVLIRMLDNDRELLAKCLDDEAMHRTLELRYAAEPPTGFVGSVMTRCRADSQKTEFSTVTPPPVVSPSPIQTASTSRLPDTHLRPWTQRVEIRLVYAAAALGLAFVLGIAAGRLRKSSDSSKPAAAQRTRTRDESDRPDFRQPELGQPNPRRFDPRWLDPRRTNSRPTPVDGEVDGSEIDGSEIDDSEIDDSEIDDGVIDDGEIDKGDESGRPGTGRMVGRPRDDSTVAWAPDSSQRPPAIATLVGADFGAFDRPASGGSRLPAGPVRLRRGRAEIELDNGVRLALSGPANLELVSPSEVTVDRGMLAATVPTSVDDFVVFTPSARVSDRGGEYELAVGDAGATDVVVRRGAIDVQPLAEAIDEEARFELTPLSMNRATVFRPQVGRAPATAIQTAKSEDFRGMITVNGKTVELNSPDAFDRMRSVVGRRLADPAEDFDVEWGDLVRRHDEPSAEGMLDLNGVRVPFESLDDVLDLQQRFMEAARSAEKDGPDKPGNWAGAFQGSINVNGESRSFSTAEEFEKAHREMFNSLGRMGINVFDSRLGEMFKDNKLKDDLREGGDKRPRKPNPFLPKKED